MVPFLFFTYFPDLPSGASATVIFPERSCVFPLGHQWLCCIPLIVDFFSLSPSISSLIPSDWTRISNHSCFSSLSVLRMMVCFHAVTLRKSDGECRGAPLLLFFFNCHSSCSFDVCSAVATLQPQRLSAAVSCEEYLRRCFSWEEIRVRQCSMLTLCFRKQGPPHMTPSSPSIYQNKMLSWPCRDCEDDHSPCLLFAFNSE